MANPPAAPAPREEVVPRLVDQLLRWRMDGLDLPIGQAVVQVARQLERPSPAHALEWQTLRLLLRQVLTVTLRVPEDTGEPAGDRYRMLSRACAAGLPLPDTAVGDPREVARDACVLLQQGNYVPAARALIVVAGSGGGGGRLLRRFAEQARDHLQALASAFAAPSLTWELRLLARVRGAGRREVGVAVS